MVHRPTTKSRSLVIFLLAFAPLLTLADEVIYTEFLSAEPISSDVLAVTTQGAVDLSEVHVTLDNAASPKFGSFVCF
jgi:hypothetical protein